MIYQDISLQGDRRCNDGFCFLPWILKHKEVVVLQHIKVKHLQLAIHLSKVFNRGKELLLSFVNMYFIGKCLVYGQEQEIAKKCQCSFILAIDWSLAYIESLFWWLRDKLCIQIEKTFYLTFTIMLCQYKSMVVVSFSLSLSLPHSRDT